ncbi:MULTISPECIES: type IX secretion system plug protein [Tenacibaculum]|uniref:type IX secretion system plug protein n=1 Tax=Tenacibaculum TaxID=104267 RepID=UPI001F0B6E80|nr:MULTISPECIES: DUF5103 domain-containing protein [Tenacibaculum]MCH3881138.1 DUF5103 domain-containing protein [Tenacibaculum aquimarinum]MDO6599262.1 DUF5103 domain-containing protein [Tenacibaculum sp. 1_MG-2023]
MIKNCILSFFLLMLGLAQSQNIKTIQLRPLAENQFSAIVPLGSVLELSFDDLDADSKEYQYKIKHMTPDWEPSNLISNQYINGFEQNYISNVSNSFNTLQNYSHYSVQIPNQSTQITKSGNYLLSVLDEYDEILFTRKFVLYENATTVGVAVYRSRDTKTINEQQTIQFSINYPGLRINNPSQEISVSLIQNNNWNTAINNLQPQFLRQNQLLYKYTRETNFWGGNEYLHFDNKYIRNTSLNIAKTEQKEIFHNYLYIDEPRAENIYTYNPDINGQFVVRTLDGKDSETEADYAMLHFALEATEPYKNKDVYVFGAFNNFELNAKNKMTYNKEGKFYEAEIPLKQGFYNYSYATINENGVVNLSEIDGSFYQTENEYTVIVYYKPFGEIYHRVIGVGTGFFDQNR